MLVQYVVVTVFSGYLKKSVMNDFLRFITDYSCAFLDMTYRN